jgi:hypothetical protein
MYADKVEWQRSTSIKPNACANLPLLIKVIKRNYNYPSIINALLCVIDDIYISYKMLKKTATLFRQDPDNLMTSILQRGLLQHIVVRALEDHCYNIIAGNRRY